jgi:hypothetical protein
MNSLGVSEMKLENAERLTEILTRAYALAMQVQDDNQDEQLLQIRSETLAGECAELLAHLSQDEGSFGDDECKDQSLVALAGDILNA